MAGAKSKSCKNSKTGKNKQNPKSKPSSSKRGRKRDSSEDSTSPPPKRTKKASQAKAKASKSGKKQGKAGNSSSAAPKKTKRGAKTSKKPKKDCVCGGARKKKKDPKNRKKRPLNAFMLFCQSVRVNLTKKCPGISMTEVCRQAGKCWHKLPENIKEEYRQKACGKTNGECPRCPHCKQLWANAPKK